MISVVIYCMISNMFICTCLYAMNINKLSFMNMWLLIFLQQSLGLYNYGDFAPEEAVLESIYNYYSQFSGSITCTSLEAKEAIATI